MLELINKLIVFRMLIGINFNQNIMIVLMIKHKKLNYKLFVPDAEALIH